MSTNYYWHEPACTQPCRHCPGADVLHIGKFSGHSWSFEGHFDGDEPRLVSAAQWWAFLRAMPGVIRDEYQREHAVEAFIDEVTAVSAADRRRHYDWLDARRHGVHGYDRYLDRVERGCDWLDAEGFSFHGGDFS